MTINLPGMIPAYAMNGMPVGMIDFKLKLFPSESELPMFYAVGIGYQMKRGKLAGQTILHSGFGSGSHDIHPLSVKVIAQGFYGSAYLRIDYRFQ
jgi:hypothetical protein